LRCIRRPFWNRITTVSSVFSKYHKWAIFDLISTLTSIHFRVLAGLLRAQGISTTAPNALAPHIYSIADGAYRNMMSAVLQSSSASAVSTTLSGKSFCQTILISGESGAGKTESTKIVLRYLTTVGNASSGLQVAAGSVMDKVLQSNPILESFGNARTIRNDNSSRFGKFIELNFSRRGHLIGGVIRTYLLVHTTLGGLLFAI
jgi:myosin-5